MVELKAVAKRSKRAEVMALDKPRMIPPKLRNSHEPRESANNLTNTLV